MGAEPSITIGDIRAVCQAHYNATQRRLSFFEAMHMAFLQYPLHAPYDIPRHFMTPGRVSRRLSTNTSLCVWRVRKTLPENIRKGPKPRKNFYINENEAFFPDKDVHAHIHIPYVCDGFHTHSHFEANYVYRGSAGAAVGNRDLTLKRGDFLIFAPNSAHNVQTAENDIVISIEMRRSSFEHIYELLFRTGAPFRSFSNRHWATPLRRPTPFSIPTPAMRCKASSSASSSRSISPTAGAMPSRPTALPCSFRAGARWLWPRNRKPWQQTAGKRRTSGRILLFIKGNYQSVTLEMLSREFTTAAHTCQNSSTARRGCCTGSCCRVISWSAGANCWIRHSIPSRRSAD